MYQYRGTVTRIIDGDTIEGMIDLGFGIAYRAIFRLMGVNAPEVRGDGKASGLVSRDFAIEHLLYASVVVHTFKDGQEKYGRYLAVVFYYNELLDICCNFNRQLVENGLAVPDANYSAKVYTLLPNTLIEAQLKS